MKEKELQCYVDPENIDVFTTGIFPFSREDFESLHFEDGIEYGMEMILRRTCVYSEK